MNADLTLALVNFPAMTDAEHQHDKSMALQGADDAVVSYAVFPELTQGALKSFADFSGIVEFANTLVKEFQDAAANRLVEIAKLPLSGRIEINPPCHSGALLFREEWAGCGLRV